MKKIKLIAICGESGTGKTAVLEGVLKAAPEVFNKIISHTTRPIRQNEEDGVTYHYVTGAEFAELAITNQMLEHSCFNNWLYGTSKSALAQDKINIGIFNPQGLAFLSNCDYIDLKIVYLECSARERLLRQLLRESAPNVDEIVRRYEADKQDFKNLVNHFAITVLSNEYSVDKDACVKEIVSWAN